MGQDLTAIYDFRVEQGLLRADPIQRAALARLEPTRQALETVRPKGFFDRFRKAEPTAGHGHYIWGGVGRGKSMIMDLFHTHTGITAKRRVHFHAFMQEVQASLHEVRKTGVDDAIKPVAEAIATDLRLLSFDEMQITDIADAMIVGRLFERLFAAGVTVVTTSNRVPSELYKDGLNRQLFVPFISLLETELDVFELGSAQDYRQDRLAGAQVYFTPADHVAQAAIDEVWRDLTNGQEEALRLVIKSREVLLERFWAGQARAQFSELCGKPLGPGDYLAIAEAVSLLIIEGVPRLDATRANEAKRFVTLIDALYEAGTRVIISADAEPEALYASGTGSFEFERTASRLREMQSADWGGLG